MLAYWAVQQTLEKDLDFKRERSAELKQQLEEMGGMEAFEEKWEAEYFTHLQQG